MVINFIPGWTRDAAKEHFFRFPEGVHRETFARHIAEVMPQNLCLEKPILAETIYGARNSGNGKVIVQRAEVVKLAYKPINPSKSVYDLAYAAKQFKAVRDLHIRRLLEEFVRDEPSEEAWKEFCVNFALRRGDGSPASRVEYVLMDVGAAEEYADMSKDGTGAYRKGKKGHKGQIVYIEKTMTKKGGAKEVIRVRPIYAFESRFGVERELLNGNADAVRIYGFYQSGCLLRTERSAKHNKMPLPAGTYLLNTIMADSNCMKLTTQDGRTYPEIPRYSLASLIEAGLTRLPA